MYLDKLVKDQKFLLDRLVQVTLAQEFTIKDLKAKTVATPNLDDSKIQKDTHRRNFSERIGTRKLTEE